MRHDMDATRAVCRRCDQTAEEIVDGRGERWGLGRCRWRDLVRAYVRHRMGR